MQYKEPPRLYRQGGKRGVTLKLQALLPSFYMPRAGAYIVSELPEGMTAIVCRKCGRSGRYRKSTLLERFGPDAPLPHVLNLLADCPKRREWSDPCQVVYSKPFGCISSCHS